MLPVQCPDGFVLFVLALFALSELLHVVHLRTPTVPSQIPSTCKWNWPIKRVWPDDNSDNVRMTVSTQRMITSSQGHNVNIVHDST